jgi:hemoglobin/transferrin/lactoferrin receptor protein
VTNLFDKAYVPYYSSNLQSYTYSEGRSVNMTLTARF